MKDVSDEEFMRDWFGALKAQSAKSWTTPIIRDDYTAKLYEAFHKMHLADGTTEGSRWQNKRKK